MANNLPYTIGRANPRRSVDDTAFSIRQLWTWKNKSDVLLSYLQANYDKNIKISDIVDLIINSLKLKSVSKTANYTVVMGDEVILVDATAGDITITLPAVSVADKFHYHITKTDSSSNTVIVGANGADTIVGDSTLVITGQYDSAHLLACQDDSMWYVI